MKKKFLCLALALAMLLSLAACGNKNTPAAPTPDPEPSAPAEPNEPAEPSTSYLDASRDDNEIYDLALGEFLDLYLPARDILDDNDTRYAMMALAEGKLLGSAVMIPKTSKGGNYAMSRAVPRTATGVLYGNDSDRYYTLMTCTDFITHEDRIELVAKWRELQGTGEYYDWAKEWLTGKGYTIKDNYSFLYTSDPNTWDALGTSRAADSEAIVNTYDGLVEYNYEDILSPALAESWEESADGLTYTFHLRPGVIWTDSQGRKVADVKADDFVASMQHMMDCAEGLEWLLDGVIKGASEYLNQETSDFTTVGVKALDDLTVEYTLEQPTPYFMTMLGYNIFAPMCRDYYVSQGGKFGADYDNSAADYLYGTSPDHIAYCGPYLVTNATPNNTIVFAANPNYWNAEKVHNKTITWYFTDGTDPLKSYEDAKAGTIDGCGFTTSALQVAREEGYFDKYYYTSATDATSYMGFFNLNRQAFANANDESKLVSTQSPEEAARTHAALLNVHFRRALLQSFDRAEFNAQQVGEELKCNALVNTYTPGTFVLLENEVTVPVNGKPTTFPAATSYGEIIQAQLDADGVKATVWDASTGADVPTSGFDGWYSLDAAKEELALAIEELAALGLEITAENPIQIDFPYAYTVDVYANSANVLKQNWEGMSDGLVQVNLVGAADMPEWYQAGYYPDSGADMNYDMCDVSGWGPDYGDPSTYLDTMLPDGAGYMAKCFGLF